MVELKNATHHYSASIKVPLPDLKISKGASQLILGLSGSGKSTLLHVLAGLLKPTEGTLTIDGTDLYRLKESARDRFRGKRIGVIFQQLHLIDSLTVMDNLRIAQYMAGEPGNGAKIRDLCESLEISEKLNSFIDELSQGQKQRVGIARAIVNEPVLILADEPTSSLDDKRAENVINLLKQEAERCGATLIVSTHDARVKEHFSEMTNLDEIIESGREA